MANVVYGLIETHSNFTDCDLVQIVGMEIISFVICLVSFYILHEFKLTFFMIIIMIVLFVLLINEGIFPFISSFLSKRYIEFKYLPGGSLSDWYEPTYSYNEK